MISSNEKPKTFESNFNEQQIRKLTDCINEAYIFTHFITTTTTTQIFNCELDTPLRISNNRLLAYFFMALKNKNLITKNWQSVCYLNQLFLSSGDGHAIKQNDLSTAANESRDLSPKDSAIIDKYVNKL
jgi:hypothetical protein